MFCPLFGMSAMNGGGLPTPLGTADGGIVLAGSWLQIPCLARDSPLLKFRDNGRLGLGFIGWRH